MAPRASTCATSWRTGGAASCEILHICRGPNANDRAGSRNGHVRVSPWTVLRAWYHLMWAGVGFYIELGPCSLPQHEQVRPWTLPCSKGMLSESYGVVQASAHAEGRRRRGRQQSRWRGQRAGRGGRARRRFQGRRCGERVGEPCRVWRQRCAPLPDHCLSDYSRGKAKLLMVSAAPLSAVRFGLCFVLDLSTNTVDLGNEAY